MAQTGTPVFGSTDPAKYNAVNGCHKGAGTVRIQRLLSHDVFDTNLFAVNRVELPPKSGIGEHRHYNREEMFIVLNGPAQFTIDGRTVELPAGATVLSPEGSSHGIYNHTDMVLQWLHFAVTREKGAAESLDFGEDLSNKQIISPVPFAWTGLDLRLLKLAGNAHKGKGNILFRRLWNKESFKTNWEFLDHCILPPETSIGYHQHNMIEEVYFLVSGHGRMTVNDHTWEVGPGDAIPCTLHDSHGLYNSGTEDIFLVVCSCAVEKGARNTNNWGDDLSDR